MNPAEWRANVARRNAIGGIASMNIFVGNLPFSATSSELEQIFGEYGAIDSAAVINDRETGRSRGFGFVEMPDAGEAKKAIEELNDYEIDGRALTVNEAKPRR
jgi:RNA recognition motif-containing protein